MKVNDTYDDVKLRPFQAEDANVVADLCNNEKIFKNLRDFFPSPYSLQDAHDFISHCQVHSPPLNMAIIHKEKLSGAIGLVTQTDVYTGSAEIGYWLGEPYWNRGIMTRALQLMVEYAFNTLGLRRIFTGVYEYNTASMRVLEKAGFQKEGISKKAIIKNGEVWDEHRFAILASE